MLQNDGFFRLGISWPRESQKENQGGDNFPGKAAAHDSVHFFTISEEFVPPNPKELERKQSKEWDSLSGTIHIFPECSSGFSKLILGAMNPFSIMIMEYTISLAPAIQHSWPVMDLVELTGTRDPKT